MCRADDDTAPGRDLLDAMPAVIRTAIIDTSSPRLGSPVKVHLPGVQRASHLRAPLLAGSRLSDGFRSRLARRSRMTELRVAFPAPRLSGLVLKRLHRPRAFRRQSKSRGSRPLVGVPAPPLH